MRYLIFADIHSNLEALRSVLEFVRTKKIDHYLFLGDLVGYAASPNEVIEMMAELKPLSLVRGNHDKAVAGLESTNMFNPVAAAAIHWTRSRIKPEAKQFLSTIKKGPQKVHRSLTICHGSPFDEDYYIFGEFDAAEAFRYLRTKIGFFGHTHFPVIYAVRPGYIEGQILVGNAEVHLEPKLRYLINPGSVGQPRDRNPLASCGIYDSQDHTFSLFRVKYDVVRTQQKILASKLPRSLAERLAFGI